MNYPDMLEREINVGDYVVYYSNVYQVLELLGIAYARIKLIDPSKITKSIKKYTKEMCIIDKEDVLAWKIKRGY